MVFFLKRIKATLKMFFMFPDKKKGKKDLAVAGRGNAQSIF